MSGRNSPFFAKTALIAASALVLSPLAALAQSAPAPASSSQSTVSAPKDRWLHVRVISSDAKGENRPCQRPPRTGRKSSPSDQQGSASRWQGEDRRRPCQ